MYYVPAVVQEFNELPAQKHPDPCAKVNLYLLEYKKNLKLRQLMSWYFAVPVDGVHLLYLKKN